MVMRKILSAVITVALIFSLSACGEKPLEEYIPDTTGYEAARDYQEYRDNPLEYEGDLVYVKGTVVDVDYSGIIYINDSNEKKWIATYLPNDYIKIKLKLGEEVLLFGYVLRGAPEQSLVGLMLIKIDQNGEIIHVRNIDGTKFEDMYVK